MGARPLPPLVGRVNESWEGWGGSNKIMLCIELWQRKKWIDPNENRSPETLSQSQQHWFWDKIMFSKMSQWAGWYAATTYCNNISSSWTSPMKWADFPQSDRLLWCRCHPVSVIGWVCQFFPQVAGVRSLLLYPFFGSAKKRKGGKKSPRLIFLLFLAEPKKGCINRIFTPSDHYLLHPPNQAWPLGQFPVLPFIPWCWD